MRERFDHVVDSNYRQRRSSTTSLSTMNTEIYPHGIRKQKTSFEFQSTVRPPIRSMLLIILLLPPLVLRCKLAGAPILLCCVAACPWNPNPGPRNPLGRLAPIPILFLKSSTALLAEAGVIVDMSAWRVSISSTAAARRSRSGSASLGAGAGTTRSAGTFTRTGCSPSVTTRSPRAA